jgi:hypothetical protein
VSSTSVKIEGVDQLLAKLGAVEHRGVRKFMLKVLVEGAKPIRAAIRSEAPVAERDTTGKHAHTRGALRAGVRYKASRKSTGGLSYMIGPFGRGTAQRHLVAGGHEIVGHAPSLAHTGKRTRPNPFVERGKDASAGAAFSAVEGAAKARFDELAKP